MDEKYFWAFLVLALIIGAAVGIAYTNTALTGYAAVNGEAEPQHQIAEAQVDIESGEFPIGQHEFVFGCTDSDGGYNFAEKGECIDSSGIHYDECTGEAITAQVNGKAETLDQNQGDYGNTLKEWYCVQGTCISTFYKAEDFGYDGCVNGEFVPSVSDAIAILEYLFDGEQLEHCTTTNDFALDSKDSIFFLTKCDRAIFVEGNRRFEVTLHGTFFDSERQEFVSHLEFKDFLGNTLCFEEDIVTAVDDAGFAVDVFEIKSKSVNGKTVETALVVIPDNYFEDFCFSQTQYIEGTATNKKYVINDEVWCKQGLGRCTEAVVREGQTGCPEGKECCRQTMFGACACRDSADCLFSCSADACEGTTAQVQ